MQPDNPLCGPLQALRDLVEQIDKGNITVGIGSHLDFAAALINARVIVERGAPGPAPAIAPAPGPAPESWRDLNPDVRRQFLDFVTVAEARRQLQGRAKYGDAFAGDPLDQAMEEMLDGVFYVWMAKREKDQSKDLSRDQSKDQSKDQSRDQSKDIGPGSQKGGSQCQST